MLIPVWLGLTALLLAACLYFGLRLAAGSRQIRLISQTLDEALHGNMNRRIRLASAGSVHAQLAERINELLEDRLQSREQAERQERMRKQMIADISHDLRTPLTSILGYLEQIRNEPDLNAEERTDYMDIISKKGDDLLSIINSFFEMARLEAGDAEHRTETVWMNELVKEEVLALYPNISAANVQPRIRIADEPLYMLGDDRSLRRIVANLLTNALRYGQEGGVLGVELVRENDQAVLTVWDQGKGITQEDLPYIFERLYTGERSRNARLQGAGLGLTIVKKLVEQLHGHIRAESAPYSRTAFICSFPLQREADRHRAAGNGGHI